MSERANKMALLQREPGLAPAWELDAYNRRLKLHDWSPEQVALVGLESILARPGVAEAQPGKVIAYARPGDSAAWSALGLQCEACIPRYFADKTSAELWATYPDPERAEDLNLACAEHARTLAASKTVKSRDLPPDLQLLTVTPADALKVEVMLRDHFADYPTPMEADYLATQMRDRQSHFLAAVDDQGEWVALISAELNQPEQTAEISDCVTVPERRGQGLLTALIPLLEAQIEEQYGFSDFYTLARATEIGVNCAFAKNGYRYRGRLTNNCRMPKGWESIHVWAQ